MDHSFIVLKGLAKYSEAMSHAMQSHPDGWVIVKNSDKTLRRKWQLMLIFLPGEFKEQYEKAKRYDTGR